MAANTYSGFDFNSSQLSAFAFTIDTFIISLKNGNVIQHSPKDTKDFRKWLLQNNVRDISIDKGHHSLNSNK